LQELSRASSEVHTVDAPQQVEARPAPAADPVLAHALVVRVTHWVATLAFLSLAFSGTVILMAHPRLYWGEVGNELTPALLELPISRNYKRGGFEGHEPILDRADGPVSASRPPGIFNENGWARSLHFLSGWFLVAALLVYVAGTLASRHLQKDLLPRGPALRTAGLLEDLRAHLRGTAHSPAGGRHYGPLQRWAYSSVVLLGLPLTVLTGLAMSPAIGAAVPELPRLLGGTQSARTLHFALWLLLLGFLAGHITMVLRSGARRQLRAMIRGVSDGT
jgi:thiosulfate reductase cytochrome b subunit